MNDFYSDDLLPEEQSPPVLGDVIYPPISAKKGLLLMMGFGVIDE